MTHRQYIDKILEEKRDPIPLIVNYIDDQIEEAGDQHRKDELQTLLLIIQSDANIDKADLNVQRVMHHIRVFLNELDQEVDYADSTGEDLEGEAEAS